MMKKIGLGLACVLLLTPILWQLMPSTEVGAKTPDKCGRTKGPLYNIDRVFIYYSVFSDPRNWTGKIPEALQLENFKPRLEKTIRKNFSDCILNVSQDSFSIVSNTSDKGALYKTQMFSKGTLIVYVRLAFPDRQITTDKNTTEFKMETAFFRPGDTDEDQFFSLDVSMRSYSIFPGLEKTQAIESQVQGMLDAAFRPLKPVPSSKRILDSIAR